ncbi:FtsK/SpoIIIE domain-containing protein [Paeniglutamicibacter psychrophenolicus]|uniref:FtsK/SpoIIIE domain-containing protein n=1 Tax=Paeniglutamicibacter psychrophenolicus TaxID=257454 RepID=UPI0027874842|nr:FtsK/SpoIIIE domain-containing protein [Paeniglutamicibacter psychrophenolicus]MDQ0093802.1 S-DNA-T family DNA segregation ATPase FtsK/SpoIIIE [Paeniglutamicibacter psychrophenolicus]
MRVLIRTDGQRLDRELGGFAPATTLAQLLVSAGAAAPAPGSTLYVDATAVPADTPLAELLLLEGSTISLAPVPRPEPLRGWSATISGGLEAGAIVPLPAHRPLLIGRSPQADLVLGTESASWNHASLQLEGGGVRVRDAGSTNGTLLAGEPVDAEGVLLTAPATLLMGGTTVLLRPDLVESPAPEPGSLHNLTPAHTAPFNRPPRPGNPPEPDPLSPPVRKDVPPASKFSYITVLAPLLLAGAMVLMLGDARFAMFAALSPVMAVGMWFEQKHRRTRNLKEEDERFTAALDDFAAEIAEAAAAQATRRHAEIPDPATTMRIAAVPTTGLWQRRAGSEGFLALNAGIGDVPWAPKLDDRSSPVPDPLVREALAASRIPAAPVRVDLTDAGVVGIVGDRTGALALARSLLTQAAVHAGPADLSVAVFCDRGRAGEWDWASWLPHTRRLGTGTTERWLSDDRKRSASLLRALREGLDDSAGGTTLLVLDSEVLTEGRDAPARELLGHGRSVPGLGSRGPGQGPRVAGIVIAASERQLPASCTTVITVGADAAATVHDLGELTFVSDVVLAGIGIEAAERCAMDLARFDDPELVVPGAALPSLVRLPELPGMPSPDAASIRAGWAKAKGFSAPIGTSESGPISLDLVKDGPHGLVGGTTGSGKSEFLRSLVAGLAARNDATRLNFILIDFKGGAAFAACEALPHTIGTISNLDEQLADRALRSLEAEMARRQRIFAAAGEDIDNLDAYLATHPAEPMPRLLLVVDEFAMLAKDFPEVLSSLVSVAAVGRTLGVHMILATQRPAGVVNDDILANTNLRVALRVQSRDDSSNVIGVPAAAGITRAQTGRAYIKLGQDEITAVQTALVTGRASRADAAELVLEDIGHFGLPLPPRPPAPGAESDASDLDELIAAITAAHEAAGFGVPRPVWPVALGERVQLSGFAATDPGDGPAHRASGIPEVGAVRGRCIEVALKDEPEAQRQSPAGWDLARGNLLLLGIAGSGTSTTLASLALAAAAAKDPKELDLLVLDTGSRALAPLAALPHTSAYVGTGPGSREQQARFLRHLRTELARRRADPAARRETLVLIDGLATLRDEFQDYDGQGLLDALNRAYADGPALGLHFAVSTTRAKAVPSAIDEVTVQKWLYRLADPYDYSALGVRGSNIPAAVPGRCVDAGSLRQMHIATPATDLATAVATVAARFPEAEPKPAAIGRLPEELTVAELGVPAQLDGEPWRFPVGLREEDLAPGVLEVYEGEHVLISGPARSGKSTLLLALAESIRAAATANGQPVALWGACDRRSPLATADLDKVAVGAEDLPALLASIRLERGPVVLLVDDAERFEDSDQSLANLLSSSAQVCVIAAGRSADLRGLYAHWTKTLRKSRCGVLLVPDVDYDGELLGVTLPRRAPVAVTPGRGYLCVGGVPAFIQSMGPEAAPGA